MHVAGRGLGSAIEGGLRVEEQRRSARRKGCVEHAGGVGRGARHEDVDPGRVYGQRLERLRMKRPEPRTIAAAAHHDDDRRLPAARRAPVQAAELGGNLVEGQRQKIGKLQERHRPLARQCPTDRRPDNRRFRQRRIPYSLRKLAAQPLRHTEDVAFRIFDVFAVEEDARVMVESMLQHVAHRLAHGPLGRAGTAFLGFTIYQLGGHRRLRLARRFRFATIERLFLRLEHGVFDLGLQGLQRGGRRAPLEQMLAQPAHGIGVKPATLDLRAIAIDSWSSALV